MKWIAIITLLLFIPGCNITWDKVKITCMTDMSWYEYDIYEKMIEKEFDFYPYLDKKERIYKKWLQDGGIKKTTVRVTNYNKSS